MSREVKFKIGQVWAQVGSRDRYTIEVIDTDGLVRARRTSDKHLVNFIHVTRNHIAPIDTVHWYQIVPRECPCGIHRNQCTYHQLQSHQRLEQ